MGRSERERVWRGRMARQADGDLSVAAFCEREGVSTAAFYQWRRRLQSAVDDPPRFVPVRITAAVAVEVVLGNGRVVRVPAGIDAGWLRDVFAAAEGSPC